MGDAHAFTNQQLAAYLGVDQTVLSRLRNEKQPMGHGTMARLLVRLSTDEASALLQSYFDDELERIRAGREAKAREMGIRLTSRDWPHRVRIESTPERNRSSSKHS